MSVNAENTYREQIDKLDEQLSELFLRRLKLCEEIGRLKAESGLEVYDPLREEEILNKLNSLVNDPQNNEDEVQSLIKLYKKIFQLSREVQGKICIANEISGKKAILVINGPNLNLLGIREPDIYGSENYEHLKEMIHLKATELDISVYMFQSNIEGEIADCIHSALGVFGGIVINPGAYTHTSVAILDALKAVGIPTVEVHISDVDNREDFRSVSLIKDACKKTISGKGFDGYLQAISYLCETI